MRAWNHISKIVSKANLLHSGVLEEKIKGMSLQIKRDCIFFNGSVTFEILFSCMGSVARNKQLPA